MVMKIEGIPYLLITTGMTMIQYLLYIRQFIYMILFNPHCNPKKQLLLSSCQTQGAEMSKWQGKDSNGSLSISKFKQTNLIANVTRVFVCTELKSNPNLYNGPMKMLNQLRIYENDLSQKWSNEKYSTRVIFPTSPLCLGLYI